jgi:hypothetical protein
MPKKRIEFARVACPTRKSDALLLAAHSRRWVAFAMEQNEALDPLQISLLGSNAVVTYSNELSYDRAALAHHPYQIST